jgi:peptide/nickel transport system permease protein
MSVADMVVPRPPRIRSRLVRRLAGHRLFVTGTILLALVVLAALLADVIAAVPADRIQFRLRFVAPGERAWLGTDNYGRDVFSRVLHGARLSLLIATSVAVVTAIVGTAVGLLAGYVRWLDEPLMRVADALMAFPVVLLAIALAAALGPSIGSAIIALSIVYSPRMARVARAAVLVIRELDYVQAARACGAGDLRIMLTHVLPNCLTPLIVQISFIFAYAILAEAILSFLGVGPPPPAPTLGNMIAEGKDLLRTAPWIALFPGLTILLIALGANFVGDGLRDALDPRVNDPEMRGAP